MASTPNEGSGWPGRPTRAARRVGYLAAAAINLLLIWLVNVDPGWRWVPLLTEEFIQVVGLVNLSLVVGLAVNLALVGYDPIWLKRLGDAVNAAIVVVILVRLWRLFPFDLDGRWSGWETPLRVLLLIGAIATGIAVVANLAEVVRQAVVGSRPPQRQGGPRTSDPSGHAPSPT